MTVRIAEAELRRVIREEASRADLVAALSSAFAGVLKARVLNTANRMTMETASALPEGMPKPKFSEIAGIVSSVLSNALRDPEVRETMEDVVAHAIMAKFGGA